MAVSLVFHSSKVLWVFLGVSQSVFFIGGLPKLPYHYAFIKAL